MEQALGRSLRKLFEQLAWLFASCGAHRLCLFLDHCVNSRPLYDTMVLEFGTYPQNQVPLCHINGQKRHNGIATNASAESFNAKVKAFRSQFRGVRDIPIFVFRLTKIFA